MDDLQDSHYKLKSQQQKHERILESFFKYNLEGVAILDQKFNFCKVNETYARDNYRKPEDFIGKNHFDLYPSNEAKQLFQQAVDTKQPVRAYARPFLFPDNPTAGPTYWDWVVFPLLDEQGEVEFVILCLRNVTEQKRMESQIAKLDRLNLVGEMAASISHEVRNPMTTVRGYLQHLEKKPEFNQQKKTLKVMIEEIDRANAIISEFLSLAKNKQIEKQRKSLNEIVEILLPLMEADANLQGHRLHFTKAASLPEVYIDEKEIRQLILNLARNGLEAMQKPGLLSIKTACTPSAISLSIADQGDGIPESVQRQIGTPFITTKSNGTGLGLSVCYAIAQRHNARLEYETSASGTIFTFEMPR